MNLTAALLHLGSELKTLTIFSHSYQIVRESINDAGLAYSWLQYVWHNTCFISNGTDFLQHFCFRFQRKTTPRGMIHSLHSSDKIRAERVIHKDSGFSGKLSLNKMA